MDSPSSSVHTLECALQICASSSSRSVAPLSAKNAVLTVGRDARRRLVLVVDVRGPRSFSASYSLKECHIHTKEVQNGKGSIHIASKGVILQFSNGPPRKMNIFMKTIEAKLELLKAEGSGDKTPISVAKTILLEGLPQVFNSLSPLTVAEMKRVRKLRGCPIPSPLIKKSPASTTTSGLKRKLSQETPTSSGVRRPLAPLRQSSSFLPRQMLSLEQRAIVKSVVEGKENIFFTGSAGTGKSLVLKRIIESLPSCTTVITAATGVAACQLGGVTLHSFAGFGTNVSTSEAAMKVIEKRKPILKQWRSTTHLVIDEISMVDAEYFTLIEETARLIRRSQNAFGGIQLVLTGDFLQLPPVNKEKFAFECVAWNRCVRKTMILKEVKRQEGDDAFVQMLQQIRVGRCDIISERALLNTKRNDLEKNGIIATRLCTHTADAQTINNERLESLKEEERIFDAIDSHPIPFSAKITVPEKISLKKGAQVMLTTNLDLSRKLSNGARGVIESFSSQNWPVVRFLAANESIQICPVKFHVRLSMGEDITITRTQLPLQLAWAISIHKSQGLTLDSVEVSLSRVFAEGQAYVALSRARCLSSLRVLDFDVTAVKANQRVVKYYESLMKVTPSNEFVIFKRRKTN